MSPAAISNITILPGNNILNISQSDLKAPVLLVGEKLEAAVLARLSDDKYLISLKNTQLTATSNQPLHAGEKLSIKVSSIQPQIVLNLLNNTNMPDVITADKLRYWRANPDALLNFMDKALNLGVMTQSNDLQQKLSQGIIDNLIKTLHSLIFSSATKKNPLFIKDFIAKTGMTLENSLLQLANTADIPGKGKVVADNLKSLLLKLTTDINEILKQSNQVQEGTKTKLLQLAAFAEEGIKSIEAKQIINTIYQRSDSGLMLQLPVALADGLRMADIFIRPDDTKEKGKKKFSSCSVVIFLDMDSLGKISVSASVKDGNFNCLMKCESEEVQKRISSQLKSLKTKLTEIGYKVDYLECIRESDISRQRTEFIASQSFSEADVLNVFA